MQAQPRESLFLHPKRIKMSDQEEQFNTRKAPIAPPERDDYLDPDFEGACGGSMEDEAELSSPYHVTSARPQCVYQCHLEDSVDNLSLEVQFGEGSSRHASEISSLSYQNLLDDGDQPAGVPGAGLYSRNESEESCDESSFPDTEYHPIDLAKFAAQSYEMAQKYPPPGDDQMDSGSSPEGNPEVDMEVKMTDEADSGVGSSASSQPIDPSVQVLMKDRLNDDTRHRSDSASRDISPRLHCEEQASKTDSSIVRKRNSLEIRGNISQVSEGRVSHKDSSIKPPNYSTQGAKPKIRKKSPGLALRVGDPMSGSGSECDRDGSSSERDMEQSSSLPKHPTSQAGVVQDNSSVDIVRTISQTQCSQSSNRNCSSTKLDCSDSCTSETPGTDSNQDTAMCANTLSSLPTTAAVASMTVPKNVNIENEYDYVKYARIQEGNSYVGMRLAYSSSNDSSSATVQGEGSSQEEVNNMPKVARQSSQERAFQQKVLRELGIHLDKDMPKESVSDEMLMEIPLNGTDGMLTMDDNQGFTLSPENTECDSVEVESVISDGGKSACGMPTVEDGLSSSQTSDIDDGLSFTDVIPPSEILKRKQKSSVSRHEEDETSVPVNGKDIDAQAIMADLKAKREALDHAISDIKTAIQRSKGVSLQSPHGDDAATDPVWVMRDAYTEQLQREEEMRRVREQIEREEEEEYTRREHDRVFSMERDGSQPQLDPHYSRSNGRVFQTPKGYDSDDETEDNSEIERTKRNKGKKYTSLPKDDKSNVKRYHRHSSSDCSFRNGKSSVHANNCTNNSNPLANQTAISSCNNNNNRERVYSGSQGSSEDYASDIDPPSKTTYLRHREDGDYDTDEETDQLLDKQYQKEQKVDIPELTDAPATKDKRRTRAKEASINDPDNPEVLIEGVLFRARYLGSTQLISEGTPSKAMRMMQAQEAVGRIKAPEGESQPSTEVDLFVSMEKIMVLNTDLQEIMMDHSLRTISYIADIGDILVVMARRRLITSPDSDSLRKKKQAKILCHVFESEEAQLIAQSIGQAFQVAYLEFLKANGIEDPGLMKEIDYQDVLNQQEIYGEELNLFANREMQKEVIVPKSKGEVLGVVIVESGWGSMVPTVVLANMAPAGAAARCGQLNIGDQIISINGISLVGLPLSTCQNYIKAAKTQTVVKLTVVPCAPVVEVLIKRPDVKYQLGFSVQNGVICSLLRGGIAERGGVRVGHRIIEINNQSVVAVPHEKIVSLLANSVGEIHMKTMPTSIFRLLTGQETPHYL